MLEAGMDQAVNLLRSQRTAGSEGHSDRLEKAKKDLAENKQFFLKLLTTQLKCQDPTEPVKGEAIVKQFALFSGVEQGIHQNQNLEELIALEKQNQSIQALNFMGKEVVYEGNEFYYEGSGTPYSMNYKVSSPVSAVQISIFDENDRLVQVERVSGEKGNHDFSFEGKDFMGNPLTEGSYRVKIEAIDEKGDPYLEKEGLTPTLYLSGKVTAIEKVKDKSVLSLAGIQVPFDQLISLSQSPKAGTDVSPKKEKEDLQNSFLGDLKVPLEKEIEAEKEKLLNSIE